MGKDYYKILDIPKTASEDDIKKVWPPHPRLARY
jgi:DnaJ-class molecular chaperone